MGEQKVGKSGITEFLLVFVKGMIRLVCKYYGNLWKKEIKIHHLCLQHNVIFKK